MNEREWLIAIFEKIALQRPSAQGVLVLLKTWEINEKNVHTLLAVISGYVKTIEDWNLKNAIFRLQNHLQKIHQKEAENTEKEEQELEAILASLDTI
jgi:hypothetical protein